MASTSRQMRSIRTRGNKSDPHRDPLDPPRRRANKRPGRGTFSNDRPPIFQIVSRETGEVRLWVCETADRETCQAILTTLLSPGSILSSDELAGYQGWPDHFTVCHSDHEWARDADGDGVREVHCNTGEGAGAALRTFLRRFRGVHKAALACYLATYEALRNATRITAQVVRRLCLGTRLHTSYR
jgi:transposase-like protein